METCVEGIAQAIHALVASVEPQSISISLQTIARLMHGANNVVFVLRLARVLATDVSWLNLEVALKLEC